MRAVLDTNVVVSGLLWKGSPRQLLDLARKGRLQLFTSPSLLMELEDVLQREKLARRLALAGVQPRELISGYAALAEVILPVEIPRVVPDDPEDDLVLACALAARAALVVSGDRHLLDLRQYRGISIVKANSVLASLEDSP